MIEGVYEYRVGDRVLGPEDPQWTLTEYEKAAERGPRLRPLGRYVTVLRDDEPAVSDTGLVLLAQGAMTTVMRGATVLDVPTTTHNGVRKPGFWVPRTLLSGKEAVDAAETNTRGEVFWEVDLRPGDRVVIMRYSGELITRTASRIRALDYTHIYGLEA